MSKTYFSEFRSDIAVAILRKDDYRYEVMKPLFEMYGFGFAETSSGCIFIDGEVKLTKDELRWVEAHEVAHILLKHTKDRNTDDEIAADMFAVILLLDKGYKKAAQLVQDKFEERHKRKYYELNN
jgi:Zn-dependent peptidase ImmA (M78 family)